MFFSLSKFVFDDCASLLAPAFACVPTSGVVTDRPLSTLAHARTAQPNIRFGLMRRSGPAFKCLASSPPPPPSQLDYLLCIYLPLATTSIGSFCAFRSHSRRCSKPGKKSSRKFLISLVVCGSFQTF